MSTETIFNRRRFLGTAAITLAAQEIAMAGFAASKSNLIFPANSGRLKQESAMAFDTIKQINAGSLNISYAESGSGNSPVVILLHCWCRLVTG